MEKVYQDETGPVRLISSSKLNDINGTIELYQKNDHYEIYVENTLIYESTIEDDIAETFLNCHNLKGLVSVCLKKR